MYHLLPDAYTLAMAINSTLFLLACLRIFMILSDAIQ